MKKLTILIFSLLIVFACRAEKDKKKRFFIGTGYSGNVGYRRLKSPYDNNNYRNYTDSVKFGYNVGLCAYYNITKHIAVETGIQYSDEGYRRGNAYYNFLSPNALVPSDGKIIID